MKDFVLIFLVLILSSCTITHKYPKGGDSNSKPSSVAAESSEDDLEDDDLGEYAVVEDQFKKPENWADQLYQKTIFLVSNPIINEKYEEMDEICKGDDFQFITNYQAKKAHVILYKKRPITVKTNGGFGKRVFVSKGACREIALFKSPDKKVNQQIRQSIDKMVLIYVYNKGTYLKDLTFKTPFDDVKYLVE